jgi:hypothetical protein
MYKTDIFIFFLYIRIFTQDENMCFWIGNVCYNSTTVCEIIDNSIICESYKQVMSDDDLSVLECLWIYGNNDSTTISSPGNINHNNVESKCVSKVCYFK